METQNKTLELKQQIKNRISNSQVEVFDEVVSILSKREIELRVGYIMKALDKKEELEKEVSVIKPDNISYNEDGTIANQTYSKQNLDNKKNKEKSLKELTEEIEKALTEGVYDKLVKLISK